PVRRRELVRRFRLDPDDRHELPAADELEAAHHETEGDASVTAARRVRQGRRAALGTRVVGRARRAHAVLAARLALPSGARAAVRRGGAGLAARVTRAVEADAVGSRAVTAVQSPVREPHDLLPESRATERAVASEPAPERVRPSAYVAIGALALVVLLAVFQ